MSVTPSNLIDLSPLTLREAIRLRPVMYIGALGTLGLHNLVDDILANSLLSRNSKSMVIVLRKDGSISITDNGVGFSIPLEDLLTHLYVPGGTELAFAVANALSERF